MKLLRFNGVGTSSTKRDRKYGGKSAAKIPLGWTVLKVRKVRCGEVLLRYVAVLMLFVTIGQLKYGEGVTNHYKKKALAMPHC